MIQFYLTKRSQGFPSLNMMNVGSASILYWLAMLVYFSVSILTTWILSFNFSPTSSRIGTMNWHGPHLQTKTRNLLRKQWTNSYTWWYHGEYKGYIKWNVLKFIIHVHRMNLWISDMPFSSSFPLKKKKDIFIAHLGNEVQKVRKRHKFEFKKTKKDPQIYVILLSVRRCRYQYYFPSITGMYIALLRGSSSPQW